MHWIKFKVVDGDNNPLENAVLRITLPDGNTVRRKTNEDGIIEINNIDPGNCKIETDWKGVNAYDTYFIKNKK